MSRPLPPERPLPLNAATLPRRTANAASTAQPAEELLTIPVEEVSTAASAEEEKEVI